MARHFTRASSERLSFALGAMTSFPFGTAAVVIRPSTDFTGGSYASIFSLDAASDDGIAFLITGDFGNPGTFATYNGTGGALVGPSGQTNSVANGWVCLAYTKTTGTATPRFHRYQWSTGAWTHGNGGATDVNPALAMTGFKVGANHTNADAFDGDMAALMMIPNYVMSDQEVERLPNGRWNHCVDAGGPGFLVEFPSKSQPLTRGAIDSGRGRATENVAPVGTTRATSDPTGFRYSRYARRR